ncbi:MAG: PQQ-dependent sugar dehydrogenase [Deinococcota bacterium]|nr:PQQ-dependent sugar dehydrogenase [Deinococcota bacterium]
MFDPMFRHMFRHSALRLLILLAAVTVTAACAATSEDTADEPGLLETLEIARDLPQPTSISHAGDGSGRLFVTLQEGRIAVIEDGSVLAEPFLDVSALVSCCGERGLLDVAFHPGYADNGLFFVNYTDANDDTVVARYEVSDDPDRADPGSAQILLTIAQPYGNHNGGQTSFGPDGYLYIGMGDGGSGGDPQNHGQNTETLLGALLRIDVDGEEPYAIPESNPFVGDETVRDEIWAYGLRNPWRFSFDRATGDLFIADVGQSAREEINFQPAGSSGGENYGWRLMEGSACYNPSADCDDGSLTLPVLEYDHSQGCSVTGGYRYRGAALPGLEGVYLFSDFCSGRIWGGTQDAAGAWSSSELLSTGFSITTFGEDEAGEVYVADRGGVLYRLVAPSR